MAETDAMTNAAPPGLDEASMRIFQLLHARVDELVAQRDSLALQLDEARAAVNATADQVPELDDLRASLRATMVERDEAVEARAAAEAVTEALKTRCGEWGLVL